ncbi:AMIN-like domain-containing (lipo)protein [Rhodococcus rhodochrous]|uniref:AMIN-like domain-containing (lipo)protein n=1 Tax=Rhodococcus rhodochrous TaxID=1829 RepID=UPI001D002DDC|nr:hypothetical protein [Rhodococcus rhodochrous]
MLSAVRGAAVILSLGVLATGCAADGGGDEPAAATADAAGISCQRVESFAGTLRVGNPTPVPPTDAPADRALAPGEVPAGVVYPVLDAVTIGPGTDSEADKVTLTFGGDGSIGWSARFVDIAFRDGTDVPAPVSGKCLLQIDLSGVDTGDIWTDRSPVHLFPSGASAIVEVFSYPSDNHLAQTFIGTRTSTPVITVDTADPTDTLTVTVEATLR